MIRSYSELITIPSFEERFEYLKLTPSENLEGLRKFRRLNQEFYRSSLWKKTANKIRLRDNGWDLGVEGYDIQGSVYVHHMNPITLDDLVNFSHKLLDPNNLISCSRGTHEAITYSSIELLPKKFEERRPGDTIPWR